MYSKYKGNTQKDYTFMPPPGYDGSRFRRRSDGRDDTFPLYEEVRVENNIPDGDIEEELSDAFHEESFEEYDDSLEGEEPCPKLDSHEEEKKESGISALLSGLSREDILLIALIVLTGFSGEGAGIETVLILLLLLCIR